MFLEQVFFSWHCHWAGKTLEMLSVWRHEGFHSENRKQNFRPSAVSTAEGSRDQLPTCNVRKTFRKSRNAGKECWRSATKIV